MVDNDGKNRYPNDENWLTDGYGDYVRHFLRAMAAMPELAPSDEEHILSSTSVGFGEAVYAPFADRYFGNDLGKADPKKIKLFYRTFDTTGVEQIRLLKKPSAVMLNQKPANELKELSGEGYVWKSLKNGGILTIRRQGSYKVIVVE